MQLEKKIVLIFILCFFIILLNFLKLVTYEKREIANAFSSLSQNTIDIAKNTVMIKTSTLKPKMKVDFWKFNSETLEKGTYLGSAILVDKKIIVNVKDRFLKKLLENPYIPVAEMSEEGIAKDWQISYNPGSSEHLKAIAEEAWRWGYIAKIKEFHK